MKLKRTLQVAFVPSIPLTIPKVSQRHPFQTFFVPCHKPVALNACWSFIPRLINLQWLSKYINCKYIKFTQLFCVIWLKNMFPFSQTFNVSFENEQRIPHSDIFLHMVEHCPSIALAWLCKIWKYQGFSGTFVAVSINGSRIPYTTA